VVKARLVDEITTRPPRGIITIFSRQAGLSQRVAGDGLAGLVGVPEQVFPHLASQGYSVEVLIQADGYLDRSMDVDIAQEPSFPDAFAPGDLGDVLLHRRPTIVSGRAVASNGLYTTPLANVSVELTGIWRVMPPPDQVVPADPPLLIDLQPGLAFDRDASTGVLQRREVTPAVGEDKELQAFIGDGSVSVPLSDRVNVSAGDVLSIDPLHPDLAEYVIVDSVSGGSDPELPARVISTYPTRRPHRQGTLVRKVLPQAPGPSNPLGADALNGDTTVFLQSMNDLAAAQTVELTGGGAGPEFRRPRLFSVTTDGEGYYRLPPIGRVAQIQLEATHGVEHIEKKLSPDYDQRVNHNDLIFS
jgi:hypothetical protein